MTEPRVNRPLRNVKNSAWCWADKGALRKIREAFDQTHNIASAIGTYFALTEIASDSESDEFQTTHAWIAKMSGLGVRTVQSRLHELAEIGAIEVTTPNLRAPSTYRLIAFGNDCRTLSNGCLAFGNDGFQGSLPTSEEYQKNKEEHLKKAGEKESRPASMSDSEWLASLKTSPAYAGLDIDREYARMQQWCSVNRKQPSRRRFVNWLNRTERPMQTGAVPPRNGPPPVGNFSIQQEF